MLHCFMSKKNSLFLQYRCNPERSNYQSVVRCDSLTPHVFTDIHMHAVYTKNVLLCINIQSYVSVYI